MTIKEIAKAHGISNWGWPEGRKGERVRILKRQMQQLLKERDYFKMAYTEI